MSSRKRVSGGGAGGRSRPGARDDSDEEDLVFEDMYEDEYDSDADAEAAPAKGKGKGKKGKGPGPGGSTAAPSAAGGGGGSAGAGDSAARARAGAGAGGAGGAGRAGASGGGGSGSGAGADAGDGPEEAEGGDSDDMDGEEEEDEDDEDDDEDDEDDEDDDEDGAAHLRVFRPGIDALGPGEQLEVSNEAYLMLHNLSGQWPCLSFDVVPDKLGAARSRFPVTATIVCGTQADRQNHNRLSVMRASELHKTQHDDGGWGWLGDVCMCVCVGGGVGCMFVCVGGGGCVCV